MARGRKGTGVEARETSIRVSFTWREKRCRETLDMAPTPPNLKYAERLVAEINRKIAINSFDYASYFPKSKHAAGTTAGTSFKDVCDTWLKTKGRLAQATLSQYANALIFWQAKFGPDRPIDELTHGVVAGAVGSHPWPSAKLCNNYLIPLRGVFKLAGREIAHLDNPLDGIENAKQQKNPPDPLTREEMKLIVADLREHYHPLIWLYFGFAFLTGMRPEELIALRWDDVDWNHGSIRVARAKSFRGQIKELKTYNVRDVDMVEDAMDMLRAVKPYTYMKGAEIFENPVTGKPWHDERSQRDHYWKPCLKRLGVRMRRAYQTRHTYATNNLMGGVNPAYIARQMGHSNAKMLFTVYAKWIDAADRGREKAKMEAVMSNEFVPNLSQRSKITGRHDWTRTNPIVNVLPRKRKSS
jgi:integrase